MEKKIELALKLNRLVHDECNDVSHDIGLRLEEICSKHYEKYYNCSPTPPETPLE